MFHGSLLDAQNAGVMGRTLNLHRFYGMHKQKTKYHNKRFYCIQKVLWNC